MLRAGGLESCQHTDPESLRLEKIGLSTEHYQNMNSKLSHDVDPQGT